MSPECASAWRGMGEEGWISVKTRGGHADGSAIGQKWCFFGAHFCLEENIIRVTVSMAHRKQWEHSEQLHTIFKFLRCILRIGLTCCNCYTAGAIQWFDKKQCQNCPLSIATTSCFSACPRLEKRTVFLWRKPQHFNSAFQLHFSSTGIARDLR